MICQLLNNKQTPYVLLMRRGKIFSFTTLWIPSTNFEIRVLPIPMQY